jgi:hypothetical protein
MTAEFEAKELKKQLLTNMEELREQHREKLRL